MTKNRWKWNNLNKRLWKCQCCSSCKIPYTHLSDVNVSALVTCHTNFGKAWDYAAVRTLRTPHSRQNARGTLSRRAECKRRCTSSEPCKRYSATQVILVAVHASHTSNRQCPDIGESRKHVTQTSMSHNSRQIVTREFLFACQENFSLIGVRNNCLSSVNFWRQFFFLASTDRISYLGG